MKKFFLMISTIASLNAIAQNPYVLNGNATQDNCHCYTLTMEQEFESGSVWNKNKIDLSQPFDYFFNVYLGCLDTDGADGIAFVLQPVSTSLGSSGNGLGFGGIVPSLGITIDTYQNSIDADPFYDHLAIQSNGNVAHTSTNNLAGPVTVLPNVDNIEDCKWHVLEINWQPANNTMSVSVDGISRLNIQKNIITDIFNNDPLVFWGFTSSTGGLVNLQKMCTSLDANFRLAPHDNTCIGTPLSFVDSSVSFGSIKEWHWNFGDNTTSTDKYPGAHIYAAPGIYNVSLNVLGGDGCLSDTFKKQITVGSYPVADFETNISPLCTNRPAVFDDASIVDVGTLNYWYWNFGNGSTSNLQSPAPVAYSVGDYTVQLYVETKEGCTSDTVRKNFTVLQSPEIDFTKSDACRGTPVELDAQNLRNDVPVKQWYWNFDDNSFSTDKNTIHYYAAAKQYNVSLTALADNGCTSEAITKQVNIYATNAFAGNDTTVLIGYPFQLQASGGDKYTWSPSAGLSNPFISNPVATLYNDMAYALTASTVLGCATTDSIHLKVVKGPEIYVPTAFTPNGDGLNDKFKIIPVGISEISFFRIVNRWGQVIFSSKNSDGWDGTLKGIPQPAGTYVWMVAGKTIDNRILKKQGTLVLIR